MTNKEKVQEGTKHIPRTYKYLDIITVCFVVVLLLSNLVASIKVTKIAIPFINFDISFAAGLLLFPASYLVGDLLTEVYGYSKSRRVIWTGFTALVISTVIVSLFVAMPPDPNWGLQDSYEKIFATSFRVSIASMVAFFSGEFCNSFVIAKLKVLFKGNFQAVRIIGSTMVGEFVDSLIFYTCAFWGLEAFPPNLIIKIMVTSYLVKVAWEILVYPVTKQIIAFLKRAESEDYYDYGTNFNPFHLNN